LNWNFQPVPDLAENWTISADGLHYTFHLFQNATWTDGKPVTAQDVIFTLNNIILPYNPGATTAFNSNFFQNATAINNYTVVFNLKTPYPPFIDSFSNFYFLIVPQHLWDPTITGVTVLKNSLNFKAPIGSGPFEFVSWTSGQDIILQRNPHYFRANLPYLDKIIIDIIPDANTRSLAFEKGEVDYLQNSVAYSSLASLISMPNVGTTANRTLNEALGGSWALEFNLRNNALNDSNVRKAIAYAINQTVILKNAFFGWGQIAYGPISPTFPWAFTKNVTTYPFNPKEATALLNQSGYKLGANGMTNLTLRLTYETDKQEAVTAAQILEQELAAIGITVILQPFDRPTLQSTAAAWNFELLLLGMVTGPDPSGIGQFLDSKSIQHTYLTNVGGYHNANVDAILNESLQTTNQTARGKLYMKLDGIIQSDLPYYWLIYRVPGTVWNTAYQTVGSPVLTPSPMAGCDTFANVYLTQGSLTTTGSTVVTNSTGAPTSSSQSLSLSQTTTSSSSSSSTLVYAGIASVVIIVIIVAAVAIMRRKPSGSPQPAASTT